jgi:hypothetical protein
MWTKKGGVPACRQPGEMPQYAYQIINSAERLLCYSGCRNLLTENEVLTNFISSHGLHRLHESELL